MITIFTDGASRGNPGTGGWGAILVKNKTVEEIGGRDEKTTNNRMELIAAIQALKRTEKDSDIVLYTDSSYLLNGITKWVKGWKQTGWITRTKEAVLNKDLWLELDALALERGIRWEYVGGHVGVPGNERCDLIATSFADKKPIKLFQGKLQDYGIPNILEVKSVDLKVATKSRRDAPAYSYISSIDGVIEVHHTWAECEKRVKGKRARYRKALNAEDQEKIIEEFGAL